MIELGGYIRDIFRLNEDNKNFRILDPTKACPTVFTAYLRQKTVTGTVKNTIMTNFLQQTAGYGLNAFGTYV